MVKYLVRRRADVDACGTHYTPYFVDISCYCIARHKRHHSVADYLLGKGAQQDIHTAAFLGDCAGIKKYLRQKRKLLNAGHAQCVLGKLPDGGSGFYFEPAEWATPLCYALRGADPATVEYLLDRGATVRGFDEKLFIAADRNPLMVRLLLEHGADPKFAPEVFPDEGELYEVVTAYGGKTPTNASSEDLVYLCRGDRGGNPDEVARLLDLGADVNYQDGKGKSALHRAARAGFLDAMRVLLDRGAAVDVEDQNKETPLFDAVRSTIKNLDNQRSAVKLLLKEGAATGHENRHGQTPLEVAQRSRRKEVQQLAKIL